jgi:ribosomal protein S18 acetylase RimI-like enzyme
VVIEYRRFRNSDPPHIRRLWCEAGLGRGAATALDGDSLESVVFAQPYFDREGLIVAIDGERIVGFVHAGFGPTADEQHLSRNEGTIHMVIVAGSHRRQGIGRELLRRAEDYLISRGAKAIFAGAAAPRDAFYFGIYGGSQPAGFLESDPLAQPFLIALGYLPHERRLIFQRSLEEQREPVGLRLMSVRRTTKLGAIPTEQPPTWWSQTRMGRLDTVTLSLLPKAGGQPLAQVTVVGLDHYLASWNQRAIGLINLQVPEPQRRKGYAQALLVEVCRRVKNDLITLAESHVSEGNEAGIKTLLSAGFRQVDAGVVYRRPQPTTTSTSSVSDVVDDVPPDDQLQFQRV